MLDARVSADNHAQWGEGSKRPCRTPLPYREETWQQALQNGGRVRPLTTPSSSGTGQEGAVEQAVVFQRLMGLAPQLI